MYLSSTSPASRWWRSRLRSLLGSLPRSLPLSSLHTNQGLPTSPDIPMCVGIIAQHQRGWPHDLLQAGRPESYATQDRMCQGKVRTGSELLRDNLIYSRGIPLSVD